MKYFAYGSNMHTERLLARCPSAKCTGIAKIHRYKLSLNKPSSDGSAKANVIYTGSAKDIVWGVTYEISRKEVKLLDKCEGVPVHYTRRKCRLTDYYGNRTRGWIYIAKDIYKSSPALPYVDYMAHIVKGAKQNRLPIYYVMQLEAIKHKKRSTVYEQAKRYFQGNARAFCYSPGGGCSYY